MVIYAPGSLQDEKEVLVRYRFIQTVLQITSGEFDGIRSTPHDPKLRAPLSGHSYGQNGRQYRTDSRKPWCKTCLLHMY